MAFAEVKSKKSTQTKSRTIVTGFLLTSLITSSVDLVTWFKSMASILLRMWDVAGNDHPWSKVIHS
jgi:hypothetical protein